MLGQSSAYSNDIVELIETSIVERKDNICDT